MDKPKRSYYLPTKLVTAFDKECSKSGYVKEKVVAAAMLARKYDVSPRGVYEHHIEELKDIVFERAPYENALKPRGDPPVDH